MPLHNVLRLSLRSLAACLGLFFGSLRAAPPEPQAEALLQEILATKRALAEQEPDARFLAFWDFDGTLLKGDCSEGFEEDGKPVYAGLAQLAIERGLSSKYPPQGGFARFWDDYQTLDRRIGHWLSYPYLVQMLAGAREQEVRDLAKEHFGKTLGAYLFATSWRVFDGLSQAGVENHVITASGELFVRAAAPLLRIPESRIHGIRVEIREGKLTTALQYPVTFAEGKRECLQAVVAQALKETPGKPVYVLAAFGNSYSTDSAFLAYVSGLNLSGGHPVAVMFNGGAEPPTYRGKFRLLRIDAIVGPR